MFYPLTSCSLQNVFMIIMIMIWSWRRILIYLFAFSLAANQSILWWSGSDLTPGILTEFLQLRELNSMNFERPVALAEVSSLRVHLVILIAVALSVFVLCANVCSHTCMYKITSCAGGRHNVPAPCKLTFDLLTLKVVSESRVTWATSANFSLTRSLSVLDLGPMYATDRCQTDSRQTHIIA